jgi:hypothetical protein
MCCPKDSDCVKSPLRCHPRESGDPYPANINWILAESSLRPTFVGMTKPEDWFLHSLTILELNSIHHRIRSDQKIGRYQNFLLRESRFRL